MTRVSSSYLGGNAWKTLMKMKVKYTKLNGHLKVAVFLMVFRNASTCTQRDSWMQGCGICTAKSPLFSCTCLWKWGEMKSRLVRQHRPRLNSTHHRNWLLLMCLCLTGAFLKENPRPANSLHTFFCLYSWMFNEAAQVKIQVKCRMCYSSGGPQETWTCNLLFISWFLFLLMDTVDGLEMLQLHISETVICLVLLSSAATFLHWVF